MKQIDLNAESGMIAYETVAGGFAAPKKKFFDGASRIINEALKRQLDIIGSSCFLLITAPIFVILTVLVASDGGPVFFSHRRVGRNGVPFGCWKFRTMVVGAEECLSEYLRYHPEARLEWDRTQKLAADPS